jgi:hypothetical protein
VASRATALVRQDAATCGDARVTTGAIYNLWPTQVDFQVELLLHVAQLQSVLTPGLDESLDRFRAARDRGTAVEQVVADLAQEVYERDRQDPLFRVELGFLIGVHDQRVQQALAHRRESFLATADTAWQSLLDVYGLRVSPSRQIRDLTAAAAACLIGATVLSFADPRGNETTPGVAAQSVVAVFRALTQPAT